MLAVRIGGETEWDTVVSDADRRDIQACLNGREEAYAGLVKRYEGQIASQMWRFSRDPTVCEELVQDVFVEAYFGLRGYRGDAPFVQWLRRIATRVGYRYWRKEKRRQLDVSFAEWDVAAPQDDPMDPGRAGQVLHALLARLPPADRLVLTLMYLEECSIDEIGVRTGWNRAMVKMRAYRARKKLKKIAERENLLEKLGWTS